MWQAIKRHGRLENQSRRRLACVCAMVMASTIAVQVRGEEMGAITDKTLVAWVSPANTTQRGGSALTLDNGNGHFDGIIFGEILQGRWMAGSENFRRSQADQGGLLEETATPNDLLQMAVVYRGHRIQVLRNGEVYSEYDVESVPSYGVESVVVFGLRHLAAGDRACFAGTIADARLYDRALTRDEIAALTPGKASQPEPVGWWTFEDGRATDRMNTFVNSILVGGARVEAGRLVLDGQGSYMVATRDAIARWVNTSSNDEDVAAVRRNREKLLSDPQRPTYHFVTPEGICVPFDPNGAIFWQGKYHLFYIFRDERGFCWGHASSVDLVHWRFHPAALFPAPGDVDRGIFSGNCFVNLKGEATMLYHGVDAGNCLAFSAEPELNHWRKLESNPIVHMPKPDSPESKLYSSWDPHGWVEGDTYYAIFGGPKATLFKSKDMTKWDYLGPILARDMPGVQSDDDLSCPDFFPIGDKYMLLCISHKRGCRYYLGRWENERFYPESHEWMNWPGGTFFAPESLVDDKGRRIMWAWVLDHGTTEAPPPYGWSGTMCMPRQLWLGDDGRLRMAPVEEMKSLRMSPRSVDAFALEDGVEKVVEGIRGDCLELEVEIVPGEATAVGIKVRRSPNGEEETPIVYDVVNKKLRVELGKSSDNGYLRHVDYIFMTPSRSEVSAQEAPFALEAGETLKLRIFLDKSIMEVFANERQAVTQRIDPTHPDSLGISFFATGKGARVEVLKAWDMAPANPW